MFDVNIFFFLRWRQFWGFLYDLCALKLNYQHCLSSTLYLCPILLFVKERQFFLIEMRAWLLIV